MRRAIFLFVVVTFLPAGISMLLGQELPLNDAQQQPPTIEYGPATTVFRAPLRDDGTVNYTEALNQLAQHASEAQLVHLTTRHPAANTSANTAISDASTCKDMASSSQEPSTPHRLRSQFQSWMCPPMWLYRP